MTVFGIGTTELILILLLMILIFGPQKITEMGMWLGQTYKKIAGISAELNQQVGQVRSTVKSTLDPANIQNPLKEAMDDVNTIRKDVDKQIASVKKDVDKQIESVKDVEKQIESAKKDAEAQIRSAKKDMEEQIVSGSEDKIVSEKSEIKEQIESEYKETGFDDESTDMNRGDPVIKEDAA